MTQDLAIRNSGQSSPYAAYADAVSGSSLAGDLLKFVKGRWKRGEAETPVSNKAKFIMNMHEFYLGWMCWLSGKPVQQVWCNLASGERPPLRNSLGMLDENEWETDQRGDPRDPWVQTDRIILKDEDGDLLTFNTSSSGGRRALGALCKEYDRGRHDNPGMFPVVTLQSDSYKHDTYGDVDVPVFQIEGWAKWDASTPDAPAKRIENKSVSEELDDEIPF